MKSKQIKIIISGGGTGGHIFPAIAIANALKKIKPDIEILFVGATGKMEMEKVPAAGYKIIGLPVAGFQRRLTLKNITFLFKLFASMRQAKKIIKDFNPDVVVGVGGYASGPVLKSATKRKIPTLIQEQNSYPGITNKILAKHVNKICVAYDGMDKFFSKEKIFITGNPVRQDITNMEGKRERAFEFFGLNPEKKTVVVLGGSLGARTINESISQGLEILKNENIQLVWQTGKTYFPTAMERIESTNSTSLKTFDFITKMDYAYAVADLIVSRAGAISISELCVVQKPSILVPSPNVAEDHQTKNAYVLSNHQAAILVKDKDAHETLITEIITVLKDEKLLISLKEKIAGMAYNNSSEMIANEVLSLVK